MHHVTKNCRYYLFIQIVSTSLIGLIGQNSTILEHGQVAYQNTAQKKIRVKQLYLTPVKTQLLQYNLTRDLMLFYHSVKIKA